MDVPVSAEVCTSLLPPPPTAAENRQMEASVDEDGLGSAASG